MFAIRLREIHYDYDASLCAYCRTEDLFIAHILAKGAGQKHDHTDNILVVLNRHHKNKTLTMAMNFLLSLSFTNNGVKFYLGAIIAAQFFGAAMYAAIHYLPMVW